MQQGIKIEPFVHRQKPEQMALILYIVTQDSQNWCKFGVVTEIFGLCKGYVFNILTVKSDILSSNSDYFKHYQAVRMSE